MIKRLIAVAALMAAVLTGCGQESGSGLPDVFPMDFLFSSGAGAWGTSMMIEKDGAFGGEYHDTDMGDIGESFPDGTIYVCDFSGRFADVKRIDKYSYSLTLAEVNSDYENGKAWVDDGMRYISAEPYGVENGEEFILYLPETPTSELPEDFLSWWPYRFDEENQPDTLNLYGLYNVETGYGFFSEK